MFVRDLDKREGIRRNMRNINNPSKDWKREWKAFFYLRIRKRKEEFKLGLDVLLREEGKGIEI